MNNTTPSPTPRPLSIDLLVATIGRKKELERLLHSLRRQSFRRFRVLIADQNPSGYLDAILASFGDLDIVHVRTTPRGASHARNVLIPHSAADIVAFPDDDCHYLPDTLAKVAEILGSKGGPGGLIAAWRPSETDFGPSLPRRTITARAECFRRAGTCAQFYRRETVSAVGGFDENLGPGTGLPFGCGEDTDYLLRAMDAGAAIVRDESVRVLHDEPDLGTLNTAKVRAYAMGRMALLHKHGFSASFGLLNVLWPLLVLPLEIMGKGRGAAAYRLAMFQARLQAWMTINEATLPRAGGPSAALRPR